MPSPADVLALYRGLLRTGTKFPNYNIREYVKRKAKQDFRKHKDETDKLIINEHWRIALEAMEVVQRQAVVYKLYARKHKSIMDIPIKAVLEEQAQMPTQLPT